MSEKKSSNRRMAGSYAMSLVSIGLVLFLLGLFALFLMYAKNITNYIKENVGFEIFMNSDVKEANTLRLKKELDAMPAVKSTEYISKDTALARYSKEYGQDFMKYLGNPFIPSIDVRFHAPYVTQDSIDKFEKQLLENTDVMDVNYRKHMVEDIDRNVHKYAIILMGGSLIMLVIAIALIRNTIRLSIYSKRFLVRSMQLVGATESFICRPFLRQGISQGFFGGLLADVLLAGVLYAVTNSEPDLKLIQDTGVVVVIFAGILFLGMLLAWLSTRAALDKFLKADLDKLYN